MEIHEMQRTMFIVHETRLSRELCEYSQFNTTVGTTSSCYKIFVAVLYLLGGVDDFLCAILFPESVFYVHDLYDIRFQRDLNPFLGVCNERDTHRE